MKYRFLLTAISFMMALSAPLSAEYVTIGTGTNVSYSHPYGYSRYSTTQSIYTAEEMGGAKKIETIAYQVAQAGALSTTQVKIYMGHTTKSYFRNEYYYENVSGMTLVYSGSPTLAASTGWEEFTLTTPFAYNGTSNLVVVVAKQASSYKEGTYYFSSTSNAQCLYRASDDNSSYGYATNYSDFSTSTGRANVRFRVSDLDLTQDGISYVFTSDTKASVVRCTPITGVVTIPATVTKDGKTYSVTSIGDYAFYGCSGLTSISIPAGVTSIRNNTISAGVIHFGSTTPPTINGTSFVDPGVIYVPASSVADYKAAWRDYADYIMAEGAKTEYEVTIAAAGNLSEVHRTIGEENLNHVVSLTVHGSINSYDFMIIRNKMSRLRNLDLSDCRIVANDYEHYTGFHTEDDKLPARAFSDMSFPKYG